MGQLRTANKRHNRALAAQAAGRSGKPVPAAKPEEAGKATKKAA